MRQNPSSHSANQASDLAAEQATANKAHGLRFGTAGVRARRGRGDGEFNARTVDRIAYALGAWWSLRHNSGAKLAIGYDARIDSRVFAERVAAALRAWGHATHLGDRCLATPLVSFAIEHYDLDGGVVVTASHNPREDSGLKVYGPHGAQIGVSDTEAIESIMDESASAPGAQTLSANQTAESTTEKRLRLCYADLIEAYGVRVHAVCAQFQATAHSAMHAAERSTVQGAAVQDGLLDAVGNSASTAVAAHAPLRIAYTPLHGVGAEPFEHLLGDFAWAHLLTVPSQREPDGTFPTAPNPNPEAPQALAEVLRFAREESADLVLAHDPDGDRLAVALPQDRSRSARVLTGNEIGVLLAHELMQRCPDRSVVLRTVVSSPWIDAIAEREGVRIEHTLTGFKWMAARARQLEAEGYRLLFAYEEALGYLPCAPPFDKDGLLAGVLVADLASRLKHQGETLLSRLERIGARYGVAMSLQKTVTGSAATLDGMMTALRAHPPDALGPFAVRLSRDYLRLDAALPAADLLEFQLEGGIRWLVRPSGTEAKIKHYLDAYAPPPTVREWTIAEQRQTQTILRDRLQAISLHLDAIAASGE